MSGRYWMALFLGFAAAGEPFYWFGERKAPRGAGLSVLLDEGREPYIMPSIPPMPPGGIAGPSSFFGFSATVASVVISNPAIDAAF